MMDLLETIKKLDKGLKELYEWNDAEQWYEKAKKESTVALDARNVVKYTYLDMDRCVIEVSNDGGKSYKWVFDSRVNLGVCQGRDILTTIIGFLEL